ncbi:MULTISPECIES: methylated-DNA--[protein]-cysteine S-methyltransferase [unclassified Amycolatopsis]|uniref:methylated-DNA--[protein]-cysteine S-methyltransferase n=1 Tax=unclassified Amycolatopsis TaxID=2618356 RepID=UPI001C69AB89|nr:methylated-DNA--[protein]-cysteine S-methyltransferase [Amycolatopsis sp. DSM 110486]QYN20522.1 methylated-DNA--[protein]-cysteine S-methyltransferase [Amycolatopsis sp. DSM 110486]
MTTDLFAALPADDAAAQARLRARLRAAAERDGLLDVAYRTVDSPVGPLLLAATDAGLVRVAFSVEDHGSVLAELAAAISPRVLAAPARLDTVSRELDEYFTGRRHTFDVAVDLRLAKGFRREVLRRLGEIPYGTTRSYSEIAAAAGSPKAVRAVGTACARNPVPLVVPCHRVVRADGSSGRYRGGENAKLALLALEKAS